MHEDGRLKFYSGIGDHMHVHEYQMVDFLAPLLLDEEAKEGEIKYHESFWNLLIE